MRLGRRPGQRGASRPGIGLLILGLLHVPLPEPDYHNVRHHDAPGEVCEHHDHLLRWHPDAGAAQDVAFLHWHWVRPGSVPVEPAGPGPGDGAAVHAHVGGWDAPTLPGGPPVVSRGPGRPLDATSLHLPTLLAFLPFGLGPPPLLRLGPPAAIGFGATFAPHASLPCLLQRWTC